MEVFARQIPVGTDRNKFIEEIAKVFHQRPYGKNEHGLPVNFEAKLHKPNRHKPKKGTFNKQTSLSLRTGTVTFPTAEIGRAFLDEFSKRGIKFGVHPRHVLFSESKYSAKTETVNKITRVPYKPPDHSSGPIHVDESSENRINLRCIQFLWQCRDNVMSIEWERAPLPPSCFEFDEDLDVISISVFEEPNSRDIVHFPFSQVYSIDATEGLEDVAVLFNLTHAVQYRRCVKSNPFVFLDISIPNLFKDKWYRKSEICEGQAQVAPYTSTCLRVIFSFPKEFKRFRSYWERSTNRPIHFSHDYEFERRCLFSIDVITEVNNWLQQLQWPLAFHVHALVANQTMDPKELLSLRPIILQLIDQKGLTYSEGFIRQFDEELRQMWFSDSAQSTETAKECFDRLLKERQPLESRAPSTPADDLFYCLHVTITPTGMRLDGPFPEGTNRIMRRYADNIGAFLRVSFEDENKTKFRFDYQVDGRDFINKRAGEVLRKGLFVGGRHFEFLAYSQSSLKEHAVWFVNPFRETRGSETRWIDAKVIIEGIGSFQNLSYDETLIRCPARYAARLSQAFTTTDASVEVEAEEIFSDEDIKRNNSNFTDGVGRISPALAEDIWESLLAKKRRNYAKHRPRPRAFQIRFQGSKGMVSVDYRLQGRIIAIRHSMIKFEAPSSTSIEIAGIFNKPGRMFLNRPLIMLLEGLGVSVDTFRELQRRAVKKIRNASTDVNETKYLLDNYGLGTSFRLSATLQRLTKFNCIPKDKFYKDSVALSILHALREIKYKARIPVPGWTLVGVADVHSYLKEGEVFVCIEEKKGKPIYLSGPVSVSRSPTIHPGDIQLARAIGVPPPDSPFAKERLSNTIVFSTLGMRSLPSMLGGGDLDGDVYNVTDYTLLHPIECHEAAAYDPARKKLLDQPATINDVIDFVVDFMDSDNIGIIATNWLVIADKYNILHDDCVKLAKLHSDAVDYPKSGIPVPMDDVPRPEPPRTVPERPDWLEPETGFRNRIKIYKSQKAVGHLFREIDLRDALSQEIDDEEEGINFTLRNGMENMSLGEPTGRAFDGAIDSIRRCLQQRMSVYVHDYRITTDRRSHLETIFIDYVERLRYICFAYSLKWRHALTEEEALVGTIKARTSDPKRRKDHIAKLREQTSQLVADMIDEMIGEENISVDKRMKVAFSAWEMSTEKGQAFGARSFSWVALAAFFAALKEVEEEDRTNSSRIQTVNPAR